MVVDGKKYNFYGFYGVTKVAADIENATTTLNGGTLGSTKLSSVTKNVKLYFGEDKSTTNVFTALSKYLSLQSIRFKVKPAIEAPLVASINSSTSDGSTDTGRSSDLHNLHNRS